MPFLATQKNEYSQMHGLSVYHLCKIDMKLKNGVCEKCIREKNPIKMFSSENNMDPCKMPNGLKNLYIVEQQSFVSSGASGICIFSRFNSSVFNLHLSLS
jgi:hypothetical protein